MSRASKTRPRGLGRTVGFFLLINMIPLGVGVWLLFRHLTGDLPPIELPEGTGFNLAVLGGALVALILVASLSLPAAHRAVKGTASGLSRSRAILAGREKGMRLVALPAMPFLALVWSLCTTVRTILALTAVTLIAVTIVFLIRLFKPDLLQGMIEQVLDWRLP